MMEPTWRVIHGDAMGEVSAMPSASFDCTLIDPPYGTTDAEWDIDALDEPMMDQLRRVTKPKGAIVVFACGQFTATLMHRFRKLYRYKLVWHRMGELTGFLDAKRRPMREHEDILVFGDRLPDYWPQRSDIRTFGRVQAIRKIGGDLYGAPNGVSPEWIGGGAALNTDILTAKAKHAVTRSHPTEKPVDLLQTLVRSYSPEGGTVLDCFCGSGTTGVACVNTGRRFVGVELDMKYAAITERRCSEAAPLFREVAARHEQLTLTKGTE